MKGPSLSSGTAADSQRQMASGVKQRHDRDNVVAAGIFLLLLWLLVFYYDRIQRLPTPWSASFRPRPLMVKTTKVGLIGLAVAMSIFYLLVLVAAATK